MNKPHYATAIAIGLFAVFVFCGSLIYGFALFIAVLTTVVATVMVGGIYLSLQQGFDLFNSIAGTLLFAIGMVFISILFFAGDCLIGYFNAPTEPLLEACVKHSGMGFILTAVITISFVGIIIVALFRVTIVRLFSNG